MTYEQWARIKYFDKEEFDDPGYHDSGRLMDWKVVIMLDHFRECIGHPIIVLSAVDVYGEHGHAENSYHLARMGCKAVDFYVDTDKISPREQYHLLETAGFGGIGIYYCWNIPVGFHVDTRPYDILQRWVSRTKGKYNYLLGRD